MNMGTNDTDALSVEGAEFANMETIAHNVEFAGPKESAEGRFVNMENLVPIVLIVEVGQFVSMVLKDLLAEYVKVEHIVSMVIFLQNV